MPSLETQAEQLATSYRPPPVGRPSRLGDVDAIRELLKQLSLGNRREVACAMADISFGSLNLWIAKAKDTDDPESPERSFYELLQKAEALAEARVVGNVLRASEKEQFWAAGMTYLERKHPEAWGRRTEDGNSPKVIVQIGVQQQEVSVTFASAPSLSPASALGLACANPGQVEMLGPITDISLTCAQAPLPPQTASGPASSGAQFDRAPAHRGGLAVGNSAQGKALAVDSAAQRKGSAPTAGKRKKRWQKAQPK